MTQDEILLPGVSSHALLISSKDNCQLSASWVQGQLSTFSLFLSLENCCDWIAWWLIQFIYQKHPSATPCSTHLPHLEIPSSHHATNSAEPLSYSPACCSHPSAPSWKWHLPRLVGGESCWVPASPATASCQWILRREPSCRPPFHLSHCRTKLPKSCSYSAAFTLLSPFYPSPMRCTNTRSPTTKTLLSWLGLLPNIQTGRIGGLHVTSYIRAWWKWLLMTGTYFKAAAPVWWLIFDSQSELLHIHKSLYCAFTLRKAKKQPKLGNRCSDSFCLHHIPLYFPFLFLSGVPIVKLSN
jgi:hypothetical protein